MRESELQSIIQIEWSKQNYGRLFRNNVGTGWTGDVYRYPTPKTVTIMPSDLLIKNSRPLKAGLCEGSADLIGWKTTVITQDMVGQTVAIFAAVEVKSRTGKLTDEQHSFLSVVQGHGGFSRMVKQLSDLFFGAIKTGDK